MLFSMSNAQTVFINEFHYDNAGTDQDEGIEIAGPAGTDLSCYKVLLYNGANGLVSNTMTLSGIIPDICNGFGTIWFPGSLENGAPDGFALVHDPALCGGLGPASVQQFLSYEGTFTAQAGSGEAGGMTSVAIPVSESNASTPVGNSVQLTGNGTVYTDFTWTSGVSTHNNINIGQSFNGACGPIAATQLTFTDIPTGCILANQAFSLSVSATNGSGIVDTAYTGLVTISVSSGSGNLNGTLTTAFFNGVATLSGLSLDAVDTYSFGATDGSLVGTSGNIYLTTNCTTCPHLFGALIDACGSSEGRNEILYINSGSFSIPLRYPELNITYGESTPPTDTYSNGFTSNTAYVDSLNAHAGCALFVDAYSNGVIPPNTTFMMMRSNPDEMYDFSSWCGNGPVWIVFVTDPNWVEIGNFKNCLTCSGNGSNLRYFRANFTNLTGGLGLGCDFQYEYIPCSTLVCAAGSGGNNNGDGLSWPYGGGLPDSSWNNCVSPLPNNIPGPLPVIYGAPLAATLLDNDHVKLTWSTEIEINTSHFAIERRVGFSGDFIEVGRQEAVGNSSTSFSYSFIDYSVPKGHIFYRLTQVDDDGAQSRSNIAEIFMGHQNQTLVDVLTGDRGDFIEFNIVGEGKAELNLMNISGQLVSRKDLGVLGGESVHRLETSSLASGLYLYDLRIGPVRRSGKVLLQR